MSQQGRKGGEADYNALAQGAEGSNKMEDERKDESMEQTAHEEGEQKPEPKLKLKPRVQIRVARRDARGNVLNLNETMTEKEHLKNYRNAAEMMGITNGPIEVVEKYSDKTSIVHTKEEAMDCVACEEGMMVHSLLTNQWHCDNCGANLQSPTGQK